MKTAMEVINPGVRQCDAVGEIQKTLFYGTEEFGGEYSLSLIHISEPTRPY